MVDLGSFRSIQTQTQLYSIVLTRTHSYSLTHTQSYSLVLTLAAFLMFDVIFGPLMGVLGLFRLILTRAYSYSLVLTCTHSCNFLDLKSFLDNLWMFLG